MWEMVLNEIDQHNEAEDKKPKTLDHDTFRFPLSSEACASHASGAARAVGVSRDKDQDAGWGVPSP